jgi:hypothetical protein
VNKMPVREWVRSHTRRGTRGVRAYPRLRTPRQEEDAERAEAWLATAALEREQAEQERLSGDADLAERLEVTAAMEENAAYNVRRRLFAEGVGYLPKRRLPTIEDVPKGAKMYLDLEA